MTDQSHVAHGSDEGGDGINCTRMVFASRPSRLIWISLALLSAIGLAQGLKGYKYCLGSDGAVDVEGEESARVCDAARDGTTTLTSIDCPGSTKCLRVNDLGGDNAKGRCGTPALNDQDECSLLKVNDKNTVRCGIVAFARRNFATTQLDFALAF